MQLGLFVCECLGVKTWTGETQSHASRSAYRSTARPDARVNSHARLRMNGIWDIAAPIEHTILGLWLFCNRHIHRPGLACAHAFRGSCDLRCVQH
jgi:hypothetical protein